MQQSRLAIAVRRAWADRLGDDYIGAEHILLATHQSDDVTAKHFAGVVFREIDTKKDYPAVRRGDPPPEEPRAV
jgi:hypothetical protein